MKALMLTDSRKLEMADVPEPEIGPDDVLVRVRSCAICGSDVHGYDGSSGRRIPPLIMGHEAAGQVAGAGKNVTGLDDGRPITFDSTVYCGTCAYCRRGEINLCDNRRVLGVSCNEYRRHGAFAEYVAVPKHIIYPLPEGLSYDHAAMIEPTSIAFHAVRRMPIQLADQALVVGCGVIGLLTLQAMRMAGCGQIIAVDLDEGRLELARRFGADETINPKAGNALQQVKDLTGGRGVDVAAEAVGATEPLNFAIESLRKGGTLALVGNVTPRVELPLQAIVTRELTLAGSCASRGEYPACIDALARGSIDVKPLISAIAPLEEGASWFDRLYNREPGLIKVILQP